MCLVLASASVFCADTEVKATPASAQPTGNSPLTRIDSVNIYGTAVGGDGALQTGTSFKVNEVYSLQIKVGWRRISDGLHILQLRFTTPEGTVYETNQTPFVIRNRGRASEAANTAQAVSLKDVAHPVAVQPTRELPGGVNEVWSELAMAGTWAQRLPGSWKMEVLLDGNVTVYDTRNFTLQAGGQ